MTEYMAEKDFDSGVGGYRPITQEAFDDWVNSVKWGDVWGRRYSGSASVQRFIGANQKVFICDEYIFVPTDPKAIVIYASRLEEVCGKDWRLKVPDKNYTLNELEKLLPELFGDKKT